jgi:hypothetical protein
MFSARGQTLQERADDLMDFVKARPEHEMSQVILLCINREVTRSRATVIKQYD